jgi:pilus assembly protein Flp/PilA
MMNKKFFSFKRKNKGASLVEYALLVALISVAAIVAMTTLGDKLKAKFTEVSTAVENAGSSSSSTDTSTSN